VPEMRRRPTAGQTVAPVAAGKWPTMTAVGLGTFMSALNASIVNIALPYIGSAFGASLGTTEWVVMAYLLIISSLLLTFGRMGDLFGHKQIYNLGLAVFIAGSVLCALAPGIYILIACRIIQGVGAGMVMSLGPAILTAAFPANERGKALGLLGTSVAMALALGPTAGGLLALSHGQEWGWSSPAIAGLLSLAAAGFAFFIRHQGRTPHPMLPLTLFRNRVFNAANISQLLNFIVQYTVVFLLPFYFKDVLRLDPASGGLLLSSFPLTMMIVGPFAGALSDRIGSRSLAAAGMGLGVLSLLLLAALDAGSGTWAIVGPLLLLGLGNGVFQAPNNSAIMGSVPREHQGLAGGFMASMRNIGMVMGVALAGAVFNIRLAYHREGLAAGGLSGTALDDGAFVAALHDALLVAAVLGLCGVITSLIRGAGDRPAKA